jgi:hypothetical protein
MPAKSLALLTALSLPESLAGRIARGRQSLSLVNRARPPLTLTLAHQSLRSLVLVRVPLRHTPPKGTEPPIDCRPAAARPLGLCRAVRPDFPRERNHRTVRMLIQGLALLGSGRRTTPAATDRRSPCLGSRRGPAVRPRGTVRRPFHNRVGAGVSRTVQLAQQQSGLERRNNSEIRYARLIWCAGWSDLGIAVGFTTLLSPHWESLPLHQLGERRIGTVAHRS